MSKIVLEGKQKRSVVYDNGTLSIIKAGGVFSSDRENVIYLNNLNAINVKKPGAFVAGYIQFVLSGGKHLNASYKATGGAYEAAQDENSVLFDREDQYNTALKIKAAIEQFMNQSQPPQSNQSIAVADEIIKLKGLLDAGVISQNEFDQQKQKLLNT